MKYKLLHLNLGIIAESNHLYVLEDLRDLYYKLRVSPKKCFIVKGVEEKVKSHYSIVFSEPYYYLYDEWKNKLIMKDTDENKIREEKLRLERNQ